jgi:hypothetical protein
MLLTLYFDKAKFIFCPWAPIRFLSNGASKFLNGEGEGAPRAANLPINFTFQQFKAVCP